MGFLLFSVGEEWFSRLTRIPSGIFWRCKIDEILISFYLWFPYDIAYLVFFKSSQVFAKHGFASVYNRVVNLSQQIGFQILLERFPDFRFDMFPYFRWKFSYEQNSFHVNALDWCLMKCINHHRFAECNPPPGFLDRNHGKILVKKLRTS